MKQNSINILDCTLRDGGYLNNWDFGADSIESALKNLALAGIRDEIGNEGYVSVVKMIQKTNISRPVFTSLLSKLQTFKVAVVENKGVKGTYIKFQEIASGSM
jgi:hypothetical protein